MAFTLQLGETAPDFSLPGVDGRNWPPGDFSDAKVLIIVFTCNHCPYVTGSQDRLDSLYAEYAPKGVRMIAINSNETKHHPDDSFDHMVERAKKLGLQYPYVRDESQDIARAYGALRTPHFYVFDADHKLRYTGRMDNNPREAGKETTHELKDALDCLLAGREVRTPLTNPIGCNVKWLNKDAHWMPAEACDLV
ncbi:MAG: thioredoxin family protein [Phycisphaeraceae bacterium]|nr:thioredoxin family protein [Phycisphaeraceae bacterium]